MKAIAEFSRTTLIGGLLVILPIYVSFILLAKTLSGILKLLSPVTWSVEPGANGQRAARRPSRACPSHVSTSD